MVRPHFGPPRLKPRYSCLFVLCEALQKYVFNWATFIYSCEEYRMATLWILIWNCFSCALIRPYRDGHSSRASEGNYSPDSKSRRDVQDYPVKAHYNSRESRGRGRPPVVRRTPLMGEQREPRFNHWRSSNQDSYHSYPPKMEPHHNQRRPSPPRQNRPPHHHFSSGYAPTRGSHSQRGPPFHTHLSDHHQSPSSRHFHSHPADRRPDSAPTYRGTFRGHKRQLPFVHPDHRNRDPRGNYSPRERHHEYTGHGMKRWNEVGGFYHPYNGEHRPSSSQRGPREMHGRGLMPERYKSDVMVPPAG